jgi:ELWxxDGT repeat protein
MAVRHRLFFEADDGRHGLELWKSNSLPRGTKLVQDIAQRIASSEPNQFTADNRFKFFSADDGRTGEKLWAAPLRHHHD